MDLLSILQFIVTAIVATWGIYQTFVTKKLEQELHLLSVNLNQSIQLLYRARDAVNMMHGSYIFMLNHKQLGREVDDAYITKFAEHSTYWAELRGLAFAINDQELLQLVNQGYYFDNVLDQINILQEEAQIRGRSQLLHTRIAKLLEATTQKR